MGTLSSTVLDQVIARLENWTPTRLPNQRFRHLRSVSLQSTVNPRTFYLDFPAVTATNKDFASQVWETSIDLVVLYPKVDAEEYQQMKDLTSDQEELFSRLAYLPGSTWGTSFSVNAIPLITIQRSNDERYMQIIITLNLVYTRT